LLVMEFVSGRSLDWYTFERTKLKCNVLSVFVQIADALAYSHSRNILHRDIKPGNAMLDETGTVKIVDFGIAKITNPLLSTLTEGQRVGTLAYRAPEQILGAPASCQSDLYAFGCVMYALVTHRHPYQDQWDIEQAIRNIDPPRPRTLNPRVPLALEKVIFRAMHKDLNVRYRSAAEISNDLRKIEGETSKAA